MSRRRDGGSLFVGRLSKSVRVRDLEDVFEPYGRMTRCDVKYGAQMAYGFVEFEDQRDAEDAIKYENNRELCGTNIRVEWSKGAPRGPGGGPPPRGRGGGQQEECYNCHRVGHYARDCRSGGGYGGGGGYRSGRGGGGGGGGGRYRSPRRRSRSRSRDRRRSRSRSRDRKRNDDNASRSRSSSRSRSVSKSRSRSPENDLENGNE